MAAGDHMTNDTPVESQTEETTLTSRIGQGYRLRALFTIIICGVLGLWGIYDYVWTIPTQEEFFERREISGDVRKLLESASDPEYNFEARNAMMAVLQDRAQGLSETTPIDPDRLNELQPTSDEGWMITMALYARGLESRPLPSGKPSEQMRVAGVVAERSLQLYGDAQEPSAYDRPVQWMFILSLVFVPLYLIALMKHSPNVYRLDSEGNLFLPEGEWTRDEITDIDMSRWMSKSTAIVEHVDGRHAKLDAYIYKDLHLIIGAIAHRLHPDQWEVDGRKVKPAATEETDA
ncbi:MAG: hypothetical protein CMJ24_11405 [Phycisphaerae bacterium]|nr:hypothetical protein [Phycisphaerae bacterium]